MADTKISALTASTTPLAGTEVLPIVQSGTTKQVSVANLTAGRAVSAASMALTSSPLPTTSGGTGLTSFTSGGLAYASSSSALATGSVLTTDGTNLGVGTSGTFYGRVQSNATSLTTPSFLAQQANANGSLFFADLYYQNMNLISIGAEFSSGALMLGALVKPNTVAGGFYSTQSLFPAYGAAIVMDGTGAPFKVYGADSTSTVAVNSARSLSLRTQVTQLGHLAPGADNVYSCGTSAFRWSVIYAATAIINTSDAREKTPIEVMTANEISAAKQLAKEIGTFKFLSAVAKKGDGARKHIGMTVQRAIEIMTNNGLEPMEYGFICYDKWDDQYDHYPAKPAQDAKLDSDGNIIEPALPAQEATSVKTVDAGDHYGLRFEELLLFVARGFEERLAALEAR